MTELEELKKNVRTLSHRLDATEENLNSLILMLMNEGFVDGIELAPERLDS